MSGSLESPPISRSPSGQPTSPTPSHFPHHPTHVHSTPCPHSTHSATPIQIYSTTTSFLPSAPPSPPPTPPQAPPLHLLLLSLLPPHAMADQQLQIDIDPPLPTEELSLRPLQIDIECPRPITDAPRLLLRPIPSSATGSHHQNLHHRSTPTPKTHLPPSSVDAPTLASELMSLASAPVF